MEQKQTFRRMSDEKFQAHQTKTDDKLEEAIGWVKDNCLKPVRYAVDPRDNSVTIFSPGRNSRVNGYFKKPVEKTNGITDCPICDEDKSTTPIFSYKQIGDSDYAFVNENLYPFLSGEGTPGYSSEETKVSGANFLVWSSMYHRDIHEMEAHEHAASFELIGDLERKLLAKGFKHVQTIKNTGRAVGGSIEHGHYQVSGMSIVPARIQNDARLLRDRNMSFVGLLALVNGKEFEVKEYDSVKVVVPYYMRRPFDAIIYPKQKGLTLVGNMDEKLREDFSRATIDITKALHDIMPGRGKEFAYNLVFHTGKIGTMYLEVLPYTQQEGGYEKAGLNVCQMLPEDCAGIYRDFLNKFNLK